MKFKVLILDGEPTAVTVVHDGEIYQALAESHPSFNLILERLNADANDGSVVDLFDVQKTLDTEFRKVSERVAVRGGEVFFDGDLLHNGVSKQIVRFVAEGHVDRLNAVVAFTEKVMTNPSAHSREQLFNWLDRYDFTITENGDIVGYKGCNDSPDGPVSTRFAPESDGVTRNGKPVVDQAVLNLPGDVIEMPRSKVVWDPRQGCRNGLHVGTYAYAKSFASVLLEVHFNPRDVVSVPTDCGEQKIRTCRYTVVGPVADEYKKAVLPKAQVLTPVTPVVDDEFEDDEIREGDTVRLKQFIVAGAKRIEPGGPETWVVRKVTKYGTGNYLEITANGQTDSWGAVRFEKVKSGAKDVTKAQTWDTRFNYTKQARYPKGHPKAGQFVPKV
jgi:hypothetical protein